MQTYAEVLSYAIPFFIVLLCIEYSFSKWMKLEVIRSFDTISSLSSGISNTIKDVLELAVVIVSYSWMVGHLALFSIESSTLVYVLCFIGLDFAGYWGHRFEHEINILWNRHIIHHSSEEFNLACALRQNVSAIFSIFFFLYIPLAVLGIPAKVIAVVAPLHLFAQFWYHTRLIGKMGILEHIIVTPSHHRVHHAINDLYLDKNFSQIFIIWDKLFGTFQEELEEEAPVYGVKKQVNTWNPILINFQHLWGILKDAWYTRSIKDKFKVFFMPTGWRPADREKEAPIVYIKDPSTQIKYTTDGPLKMHIWMWFQLILHIVLMLYMFQIMPDYSFEIVLLYGIFLFLSIFAYTSLMDFSNLAIPFEVVKLIIGFALIYSLGSWYDIDTSIPFGTVLISIYLIVSLVLTVYFKTLKNTTMISTAS
ncbi:MAG: sterol desaturase family protein [Saprospiraceae bacterium]|nr:sterol desaturase family protein [Saprospiraceae bacterium]